MPFALVHSALVDDIDDGGGVGDCQQSVEQRGQRRDVIKAIGGDDDIKGRMKARNVAAPHERLDLQVVLSPNGGSHVASSESIVPVGERDGAGADLCEEVGVGEAGLDGDERRGPETAGWAGSTAVV